MNPRPRTRQLALTALGLLLACRAVAHELPPEAQKFFQLVFNSAPLGFFLYDTQGRITDLNERFVRIIGSSRKALLGLQTLNLPDAKMVTAIRESLAGRQGQYEGPYRSVTGNKLTPVRALFNPVRDNAGRLTGGLGIIEDVSTRALLEARDRRQRTIMFVLIILQLLLIAALLRALCLRKKTQATLTRERERLASILEGTNVGTWEWNVQTGETVFNERWAEIIGYTLAEISPVSLQTWERFTHPDDLAASTALLERHFRGELAYYECEARMRHKEGGWIWILDRGRVSTRTADGKPLLMQGTHQDITARRRTDDDLRESRRLFADLIDNSGTLIIIKDPEGRYRLVNRKWEQLTGMGRDHALGKKDEELFNPALARQYRDNDLAVMERGTVTELEEVLETPQGKFHLLSIKFPLHNTAGETTGLCGIITDITDRKQAEQQLAASEEQFKSIVQSSPMAMYFYQLHADNRLILTGANPAADSIIGISHRSLIGKDILEAFPNLAGTGIPEMYRKVASREIGHQAFEIPYQDERFAGYYAVHVFPTLDNQIAVNFLDISDRKAAEQLLEAKNRELEQLVYVASHDLRSPLVNVEGYSRELEYAVASLAGLLAGGDGARLAEHLGMALPEMEKALARIRAGSRQMDTLLKGLLKLSRSGRAALTIATLDMDGLLQRVVTSLSFQAQEAGATITVEALPPCRGDEVQLGQVFTNLIGNALKYLDPHRPGNIRITGTTEGAASVYCVTDNGIGIDPRHQEKIFELFHRLDPAHSEGEGLGLTIVRQILQRLDGRIHVVSSPGEGSKFYVTLPRGRTGTE